MDAGGNPLGGWGYQNGGFNTGSVHMTAVPAGGGGGPRPGVAPADVTLAFSAVTGQNLSEADLAQVLAAIKDGSLTLDGYIASLITQAEHTTVPALIVSQFFGQIPSQTHLGDLAKFSAAQFEAYTRQGVADPALGPFEALGLGFSDTVTFTGKYGALSDADFLGKAYSDVFGRAPTADQAKHFAAQIQYFETLYASVGQTTAQADLHAKGAILGQMLGYAVVHEHELHSYDDAATAFLQNAAKGQAQYGDGMLV
jgi:hypothetical protein